MAQELAGCPEHASREILPCQGETKGIKDFIAVLIFYRDYAADEIEAAVLCTIEHNISANDGVRYLLVYADSTDKTIPPLASWSSLPPSGIAVYGQRGGVQ